MDYNIQRSETTENKLNLYSHFLSDPTLTLKYTDIRRCTPQYLKWQYVDNPNGQFIGFDAYFKGNLVSHFATLPVLYNNYGKKEKGLLALNLVTHPDHRGKGLFLKIANRTFDEAINSGYKFVIGVANQNSTHGLIKRLGFSFISPLLVKFGIGEIIPKNRENYPIHSLWDEESLAWRLLNPSARYFRNKDKFVVTNTGKFNIYAQLHYQDFLYEGLLNLENKNTFLKIWIGLSDLEKRSGIFVNLPKKLKPVPLNLIYRDLEGKRTNFNREEFFIELIDFDAY